MLRRTIYSTILTAILSFLIIWSVPPHGGEDEVAAAFSDGMILTTSLMAAVVVGVGLRTIKLRPVQMAIAALVIMTGIVHLMSGVDDELLLLLNGLGYVAILAALHLLPMSLFKSLRVPLYGLLIAYTLITIISFFAIHPWGIANGELDWLGLVTKAAEVVLVALVLVDWWQHRQALPDAPTEQASQPA